MRIIRIAAAIIILTGCQQQVSDPTAIPAPDPERRIDCNLIFPAPSPESLNP